MYYQVYAARETNDWNISGRDLAASITGPPSEYIPSLVFTLESCASFCFGGLILSYVPLFFVQGNVVDKLALQIFRDPHHEIVILTLGAGSKCLLQYFISWIFKGKINRLKVVTILNDQVILPLLAPSCSINCKIDSKMQGINSAAATFELLIAQSSTETRIYIDVKETLKSHIVLTKSIEYLDLDL